MFASNVVVLISRHGNNGNVYSRK